MSQEKNEEKKNSLEDQAIFSGHDREVRAGARPLSRMRDPLRAVESGNEVFCLIV